ncbi:MAG: NYN domain-containing protein [bacterium]|nr:NYN domain-containing protein [bacterium]
MKTQRVLVLVDEANLTCTVRGFDRWVDWKRLRDYLACAEEGRQLLEMAVYVGMPPTHPDFNEVEDKKDRFVYWLETNGFLVVTREGVPAPANGNGARGPGYKANVDVLMAMDAVSLAAEMRPDVVVLVTGDADFAPLARHLRRKGIRVEAAGIEGSMSRALRSACNDFIDLAELLAEFPGVNGQEAPALGTAGGLFA